MARPRQGTMVVGYYGSSAGPRESACTHEGLAANSGCGAMGHSRARACLRVRWPATEMAIGACRTSPGAVGGAGQKRGTATTERQHGCSAQTTEEALERGSAMDSKVWHGHGACAHTRRPSDGGGRCGNSVPTKKESREEAKSTSAILETHPGTGAQGGVGRSTGTQHCGYCGQC